MGSQFALAGVLVPVLAGEPCTSRSAHCMHWRGAPNSCIHRDGRMHVCCKCGSPFPAESLCSANEPDQHRGPIVQVHSTHPVGGRLLCFRHYQEVESFGWVITGA